MAGCFASGAVVGGIAVAATQPPRAPPATETITTQVNETKPIVTIGDINALRAALERDGFIVQEGEFSHQDAIALLNAGVTKDAAGANVGAPYLAYKLPPAPDQTAPNPLADDRGWSYAYRLRPDEALILVGRTPPEVAYFSYQSYLVLRFFPDRKQYGRLYDSIGDSINLLTINSAGTPGGSSGNPFDQPFIIISTADRGTDSKVRAAAQSSGYSSSIMNTDVIPQSMVKMGLEPNADLFHFSHRVAVPKEKGRLDAYLEKPGCVVLRVTPKTRVELDPYPAPAARIRGTGKTEIDLLPAVEDLRKAILAKYSNLAATELVTYVWSHDGYECIQSRIDTTGDTRDAAYFSTLDALAMSQPDDPRRVQASTLPDDPNEFFIIYGVDHEVTGKATYCNCNVIGLEYFNGVANVFDSEWKGSAEDYVPGPPEAKYLYAWKVSRRSNGDPHCLEVPTDPSHYGIGLDERIWLFFRVYLERATRVGPAWNELVLDRVIKFSPKR